MRSDKSYRFPNRAAARYRTASDRLSRNTLPAAPPPERRPRVFRATPPSTDSRADPLDYPQWLTTRLDYSAQSPSQ